MTAVSAGKAALNKMQADTRQMVRSGSSSGGGGGQEGVNPNGDMKEDAVKRLSQMIKNKDLEIESLNLKNGTLLQVRYCLIQKRHSSSIWLFFGDFGLV